MQAYGQNPNAPPLGVVHPLPPPQPVTVTDVRMPFLSMVVFMIKWALASIPAMLIRSVFFTVIGVIFFFVLAALGLAAGAASH